MMGHGEYYIEIGYFLSILLSKQAFVTLLIRYVFISGSIPLALGISILTHPTKRGHTSEKIIFFSFIR